VPSVGWNGCTVGREKIVAGALLAPWDELRGNTQRSEPVSTKNLRLLTLSAMNRRPVGVEQASAAINACLCRFPAGCRSTVECTFALRPRIACGNGNNRDPRGRVPKNGRLSPCVCLWNENGVGCGHCLGLPIGGTDPQSSGED